MPLQRVWNDSQRGLSLVFSMVFTASECETSTEKRQATTIHARADLLTFTTTLNFFVILFARNQVYKGNVRH
jgi:hypothetical protein